MIEQKRGHTTEQNCGSMLQKSCEQEEEPILRQGSHIQWTKARDRDSIFFLRSEEARTHGNAITRIITESGKRVESR